MNLIIDIGNSSTKLALFEGGALKSIQTYKTNALIGKQITRFIESTSKKQKITHVLWSNVSKHTLSATLFSGTDLQPVEYKNSAQVPISIDYKTPKTLGKDRLALASGAALLYPNQNNLVISLGTCITYEFISNDATYQGGSISPGIDMRFKALHSFTGKLPKMKADSIIPSSFIGQSTHESMQVGVFYGVLAEIQGIIDLYVKRYNNINIILTGGQAFYFENELKNRTFAVQYLSLIGLNCILDHNK